MENGKVRFRQQLTLELSQSDHQKFLNEKNRSDLVSELIEKHYNNSKDVVEVKIDERIREAYQNDLYRDFRIQKLLLDFYANNAGTGIEKQELNFSNNTDNNIKFEINKEISSSDKKVSNTIQDLSDNNIETEVINNEIKNEIVADDEKELKETIGTDEEENKENESITNIDEHHKEEEKDNISEEKDEVIQKEMPEHTNSHNNKVNKSQKGSLNDILPINNKSLI